MGVDITHVDVGGGLGVDYDGTKSTSQASVNYSLQEYANDVIYTLAEACREHELPMPHIISESGRALTAHHALLLLNVIDVESQADDAGARAHRRRSHAAARDGRRLRDGHEEAVSTAARARGLSRRDVRQGARAGALQQRRPLASRARDRRTDLLSRRSTVVARSRSATATSIRGHHRAISTRSLVDRYFCNFSLFQSLPDSWAIDQLFPIMPIHRLDEEPTRRGTIQDVTCDSDGKIDRFVGDRTSAVRASSCTTFRDGEPYILGIFLTGAYQEILGDLHNLFGDTNAVHIRLAENGEYEVTDLVHGDTVTEVLELRAVPRVGSACDVPAKGRARRRHIARQEANTFIADYVAGLEGYTYLEGDAAQ